MGVFPTGAAGGPFGRRQATPRGARVPVVLVTGFLGAGKTTLIREFLGTEAGRGTAVVVNEFGEVGIDDALLAPAAQGAGAGTVALLGNGCLCCAIRGEIDTTFRALLADRARGAVPPFRRVVLETSGADDPAPVLQTFLSERALAREFHLQAVIAVVDAASGAASLETAPEARRQVALADRILLSKTDLAGEATALRAALRALNPHAPIALAARGRVDPEFLLAESTLLPRSALLADAPVHVAGLASFTLEFGQPMAWRTLTAALGLLTELRGADLLRVKGLVAVEGCAGPVVVHAVQHVLHPPMELTAWPEGGPRTRLVFITRGGLSRERVEAVFAAVLGVAG
ncbi:MAG: GTP-binding protein [Acetobacteraceae bacterium]|nr:GTP-binding protein [Acetobacteraceae bacterium]